MLELGSLGFANDDAEHATVFSIDTLTFNRNVSGENYYFVCSGSFIHLGSFLAALCEVRRKCLETSEIIPKVANLIC